ncbi:MAG TPA: amidohydrolase [Candidatus Eremiobacteraceae bacterium]|nr:amidohydrolase [Candidatus Eremiobacteraceae bacterium]
MTEAALERVFEDVIGWRRSIHEHPELGFEEERTSALVEKTLRAAGIETTRVAKTGVVGVLKGGRPGKTIAFRADMDALPLDERSGEAFSSKVPGVMHACGHDAHTAMLLGAAVSLAQERATLAGTIKFFFQPAEEGPGGALPMIEAGVMDAPKVDAAVMIHVSPLLLAGTHATRPGAMSASCDDFAITVRGRGGHGAYPHGSVDTIPIAAEIVGAVQRIVSREIDPLESVVMSIGVIRGGYRRNIIADKTVLEGTFRCLDEDVRKGIPARLERMVKGICDAHRATYEIEFEFGYPSVMNDPALVERIVSILEDAGETVEAIPRPSMGAEDFAYFAQRAPGCYLRLGVGFPGDTDPAMTHSPEFRLDERALATGVRTFRTLARTLPIQL